MKKLEIKKYLENRCSQCGKINSIYDVRCPNCGQSLKISLDSSGFLSNFNIFIQPWEFGQLKLNSHGFFDDLFLENHHFIDFIVCSTKKYIYDYLLTDIFPDIIEEGGYLMSFPDIEKNINSIMKQVNEKSQLIQKINSDLKDVTNPFKDVIDKYSVVYQEYLQIIKQNNKKYSDKNEFIQISKKNLQIFLKEFQTLYKSYENSLKILDDYERITETIKDLSENFPADLFHIKLEYEAIIDSLTNIKIFSIKSQKIMIINKKTKGGKKL